MLTEKELKALKTVTRKLNALRETMRKPERQMLDALVLGTAAQDVEAHGLREAKPMGKTAAVRDVAAHGLREAKPMGKTAAVRDVSAHGLREAKPMGKTAAVRDVSALGLREAKPAGKTAGLRDVAAHRFLMDARSVVYLDPESGKYELRVA